MPSGLVGSVWDSDIRGLLFVLVAPRCGEKRSLSISFVRSRRIVCSFLLGRRIRGLIVDGIGDAVHFCLARSLLRHASMDTAHLTQNPRTTARVKAFARFSCLF